MTGDVLSFNVQENNGYLAMVSKPLIFGSLFTLGGLAAVVPGVIGAYRTYDRLHHTRETSCVLLDKRITDDRGGHQSWGRHAEGGHYEAWARVGFTLDGHDRVAEGDLFPTDEAETGKPPSQVLATMVIGKSYPLWVNPDDRSEVMLSRGTYSPWSFLPLIAVGGLFSLAGLATLREAATSRRPPLTSPTSDTKERLAR